MPAITSFVTPANSVSVRSLCFALLFVIASLNAPVAASVGLQDDPPWGEVLEVHYDSALPPSHPEYDETLAFILYPPGRGPLSLGYAASPMPVVPMARGGNTNTLVPGSPKGTNMADLLMGAGFVEVLFNYPIVDGDEDYRVAADGIGLLIQYLRANATELNIDPEQILLQARSFGVLNSYSVALCDDRADPDSPDPVRRESSRMDYFIPRFGPTTLLCFSDLPGPWSEGLNVTHFPGKVFEETTQEERIAESPTHWMLKPQLYGREWTPPMFVLRSSSYTEPCGEVDDVHSGIFGRLMLEAMDDFARESGDWVWRARCSDYDNDLPGTKEDAILAWIMERMAEDFGGLWLKNPSGVPGSTVTFEVHGAVPGNSIAFFEATESGSMVLPDCPGVAGDLGSPSALGTVVADASGVATLSVALPASAGSADIHYQAIDVAGCEVSNSVVQRW